MAEASALPTNRAALSFGRGGGAEQTQVCCFHQLICFIARRTRRRAQKSENTTACASRTSHRTTDRKTSPSLLVAAVFPSLSPQPSVQRVAPSLPRFAARLLRKHRAWHRAGPSLTHAQLLMPFLGSGRIWKMRQAWHTTVNVFLWAGFGAFTRLFQFGAVCKRRF